MQLLFTFVDVTFYFMDQIRRVLCKRGVIGFHFDRRATFRGSFACALANFNASFARSIAIIIASRQIRMDGSASEIMGMAFTRFFIDDSTIGTFFRRIMTDINRGIGKFRRNLTGSQLRGIRLRLAYFYYRNGDNIIASSFRTCLIGRFQGGQICFD